MPSDLTKYFPQDRIDKSNFLQMMRNGLLGLNRPLDFGFSHTMEDHLGKSVEGVTRATYMLLVAMSGAGKTTLLDKMLWSAYKHAKQHKIELKIVYYSFEISKMAKMARLIGMAVKEKLGESISSKAILGIRDDELSDTALRAIAEVFDEIEEFVESMDFIDIPTNPTGIKNHVKKMAVDRGEIKFEEFVKKIRTSDGEIKEEIRKKPVGYIPKNPKEFVIVGIDHISLVKKEMAYNHKQSIDKLSEIIVQWRNLFGYTFIVTQQMNNNLSSSYRGNVRVINQIDITPDQQDLSDSTYTYRDADIVLGLVKPARFGMTAFKGKGIAHLGERFLVMYLMKHRYDATNKFFLFDVEQGGSTYSKLYLEDLPSPSASVENTIDVTHDLVDDQDITIGSGEIGDLDPDSDLNDEEFEEDLDDL